MKKILLVVFGLVSLLSSAQVSSYFHGDAKVFSNLKTRNLIVELLEPDAKIVKKLSKPKFATDLKLYNEMISNYNSEIQLYAKKYWTLNSNIVFKTKTEVEALHDQKDKSFAVLRNLRLKDIDIDFGSKSNLFVTCLVFTRIETNYDKADSQVYLPTASKADGKFLLESDYKFCLDVLQSNINYIITNKKNINSEKYVQLISKGNCKEIGSKTLLVKESILYEKTTKAKCIAAYGSNIKFVSDEEFDKAFIDKAADKVCLFSVPWEIGKGGMGPVSQSFIMSFKVVVDCQTGKLLYQFLPTGFAAFGQNISYFVMEKDLENIKNCK